MRKYLLIALLISSLITSAQTSISNGNCKAVFKHEVNDKLMSPIAATAINFYDQSVGNVKLWFWDFGDGNTSNEQNPMHLFTLPLTGPNVKMSPYRTVSLTILTSDTCKSMYSEVINIMDGTIYNPNIPTDTISPQPVKCETAFGYNVNHDIKTFAPALVLDFYSKAYPETTKWRWDFGDGTSSDVANPTHIFNYPLIKDSAMGAQSPFRNVCLTVETSTGCVASSCQSINIYMDTTPVDTVPQCHAWIKYYPVSDVVTIPEVVVYKLVDASQGKVLNRLWKFEDGTTSTEAEPQVTFDRFKPTQKVCLTVNTAEGCTSSWCEIIYVSGTIPPDSGYVTKPVNRYTMRYESSFPIYMSSCAGWAKAQVYMNDSLVNAVNYVWSNGTEGQEVKGLCPTQIYTVKAIAPDGTYVSGTFLFNSDGTVTDAPFNWWVSGKRDDQIIQCDPGSKDYTVEWKLCDGTIVKSDSIPFNSINCGGNETYMYVKDATGAVVYTENISQETLITRINQEKAISVKLYPNPVKDVLNIQYSGNRLDEMQLEICDITGRSISLQRFYDVESGQQISLNVNSLTKGIYLCKMISGKQVIRIEKFSK